MLHRTLRERLREGGTGLGCFVNVCEAGIAETLGASGFQFMVLDNEHGVFSQSDLEKMIIAGETAGLESIVRVDYNPSSIQKALDMGASGVLVPMIRSAEDARQAIRRAKYPPWGTRGADYESRAYRRHSREGQGRDYIHAQNESTLVMLQIETAEAYADLDQILEVTGIDVIFVGSMDLSLSLGENAPNTPRMREITADIVARATAKGIPAGAVFLDPAMRRDAQDQGYRVLINTLTTCLKTGIAAVLQEP